jgi:hypothetical protein
MYRRYFKLQIDMTRREPTPHNIINKMPKLENKGYLKAAREKHQLTHKSKHHHLRPFNTNPKSQESMEQYNSNSERE